MARPSVVLALVVTGGLVPLVAAGAGWEWYLDSPLVLLVAVGLGYAAGAFLPRGRALLAVATTTAAHVAANQFHTDVYHWLDDLVFYLVVVAGPAAAGAAVTTRSQQVRRLQRLQADLDELHRIEVAAARLDEQSRVSGEVHALLAESIAGIAIRAEGARRAADPTALPAIEAEARTVLDRLRETLGSLRADDITTPVQPPAAQHEQRLTLLDMLVPAVIGLAMAVETSVIDDARGPVWANALAALAVVAPLAVRRRRPILAVATTSALGVAMSAVLTPIPETVTGIALLVVMFYSAGAWCRGWWWLLGWGLALLGAMGMEALAGSGGDEGGEGDSAWIVLVWTVGAVAVGRITAGWQERVTRTKAVVDELERGRGAAVRLAVAQEREALASQLHDTVAHAMTVVCLQAGAQQRAGTDHEGALQVIASIAESSLTELRDGLEAMETVANPLDASHISALARRVGVDVDVSSEHIGTGPAAVLAHRVIREAIVNVARHAPGATAAVHVESRGDELAVEVVDTGTDRAPVLAGTGTGLRGLAEAVESAGGRLSYGPREPAGFGVSASIPQEQG